MTALLLLVWRPDTLGPIAAWASAALLAPALLSTVLVQVPLHRLVAEQHDPVAARRLTRSNWVRTAAWTARGLVLAVVLAT